MKKRKALFILILLFIFICIVGCDKVTTITSSTTTNINTDNPTTTNINTDNPTSTIITTISPTVTTVTNSPTIWTTITTKKSDSLTSPITDSETLALMETYYSKLDFDTLINANISNQISTLQSYLRITKKTSPYKGLNDMFKYTDSDPNHEGYIILFYSHASVPSYNTSTMNKEHVWPQSLGASKDQMGGHDMHHVRPTYISLNSARSNYLFNNCQGLSSASEVKYNNKVYAWRTKNCFEPLDNVKGDCARICFYYAIMYYSNVISKNGSLSMTTALKAIVGDKTYKTILEWNELDPVDDIEIARNNYVQSYQGNRNIFIDYPDLANYIWD